MLSRRKLITGAAALAAYAALGREEALAVMPGMTYFRGAQWLLRYSIVNAVTNTTVTQPSGTVPVYSALEAICTTSAGHIARSIWTPGMVGAPIAGQSVEMIATRSSTVENKTEFSTNGGENYMKASATTGATGGNVQNASSGGTPEFRVTLNYIP